MVLRKWESRSSPPKESKARANARALFVLSRRPGSPASAARIVLIVIIVIIVIIDAIDAIDEIDIIDGIEGIDEIETNEIEANRNGYRSSGRGSSQSSAELSSLLLSSWLMSALLLTSVMGFSSLSKSDGVLGCSEGIVLFFGVGEFGVVSFSAEIFIVVISSYSALRDMFITSNCFCASLSESVRCLMRFL